MRDVSLRIPEGCVTALIGRSGCGKSTFLRCLNRMIDEDGAEVTGSVRFAGREILSPHIDLCALRREVGMVFQSPQPFPMSVFDNVAYGIRLQERLPKKALTRRIEEALSCAGLLPELSGRLSSDARRLSGGQQQRLCIARALVLCPRVLLLDEPTAALDPVSTAAIERLLRELIPRMTVVIVTHNLAQAKRIADRVVFFGEGTVLQSGGRELLDGVGAAAALREYLKFA